ncbi:MAG: tetratricopeptide repeat protein [Candidatus Peribacteraceae bacterium]
MSIPPRILVPVILAALLSTGIGGVFFWQIKHSVDVIESSFQGTGSDASFLKSILGGRKLPTLAEGNQSEALLLLKQGELFEYRGEWKKAEEKYQRSSEVGGGVLALKKLAAIQLQRRSYDAAKSTIDHLEDGGASREDIQFLRGILALRSGKPSDASSAFRAIESDPKGIYGQALVAIARKDMEGAKTFLVSAQASADPTIRSYATTMLEAIAEFALFPESSDAHLMTLVARALAETNECEVALSLVLPVTNAKPQYRDAWIVRGFCEFTTERTTEALASLERAYSLDPEKPEIQYFLARTHAALGDPDNAVTYLQYAILNGFKPERDARELLAEYAKELGQTELALTQYTIIAEENDGGIEEYGRAIELAASTDVHALDALDLAKKAQKKWPDDAQVIALLAVASHNAGLPEDAKRYADRSIAIDPKNELARAVLNGLDLEREVEVRP